MRCVLLSGGMDSTCALFWALERGPAFAISIDYGQTHRVELAAARRIADLAGVEIVERAITIPWQASRLTGGGASTPVVPGRNGILATVAAAEAKARGASVVVMGCVLDDANVFPDCRPDYIAALSVATRLGMGVSVVAPFVRSLKSTMLAEASPQALEAVQLSWSCYEPQGAGARAPIPCGKCPACVARKRAFAQLEALREAP